MRHRTEPRASASRCPANGKDTMFTSEKPGTAFHGSNRKWISRLSQNPSRLNVPNLVRRRRTIPWEATFRVADHSLGAAYTPAMRFRSPDRQAFGLNQFFRPSYLLQVELNS